MVTRKEVALRAGVSVSVVSRAMNNSGYVEAEKKKRILAIAEELGYYPHPVAEALQKRRTKQILFFLQGSEEFFLHRYVQRDGGSSREEGLYGGLQRQHGF